MMYQNHSDSQNRLLQKIYESSFAACDILLYLDTHPCDEKALEYYDERISERKKALIEYAQNYGPLTMDTVMENCDGSWKWMEQPFPWEQEGECR